MLHPGGNRHRPGQAPLHLRGHDRRAVGAEEAFGRPAHQGEPVGSGPQRQGDDQTVAVGRAQPVGHRAGDVPRRPADSDQGQVGQHTLGDHEQPDRHGQDRAGLLQQTYHPPPDGARSTDPTPSRTDESPKPALPRNRVGHFPLALTPTHARESRLPAHGERTITEAAWSARGRYTQLPGGSPEASGSRLLGRSGASEQVPDHTARVSVPSMRSTTSPPTRMPCRSISACSRLGRPISTPWVISR